MPEDELKIDVEAGNGLDQNVVDVSKGASINDLALKFEQNELTDDDLRSLPESEKIKLGNLISARANFNALAETMKINNQVGTTLGSALISSSNVDKESFVHSTFVGNEFGKSRLDKKINSINQLENLNDTRAMMQSGLSKILNGVVKGIGIFGTSAIDGTGLGFFAGLVQSGALTVRDMLFRSKSEKKATGLTQWQRTQSYFINNVVTTEIYKFQQKLEEWLPNYYREGEGEMGFFRSLGSANFWGNEVLKNTGYFLGMIVGSYLGSEAWDSILGLSKMRSVIKPLTAAVNASKDVAEVENVVKTASKAVGEIAGNASKTAEKGAITFLDIAQAFRSGATEINGIKLAEEVGKTAVKLKKYTSGLQFLQGYIAADSESRLQAYSASQEFKLEALQYNDDLFRKRQSEIENEIMQEHPELYDGDKRKTDTHSEILYAQYRNAKQQAINDDYMSMKNRIENEALLAGNANYWKQMPTLFATDLLAFGHLLKPKWSMSRAATNPYVKLTKDTVSREGKSIVTNVAKVRTGSAVAKSIIKPISSSLYEGVQEWVQDYIDRYQSYRAYAKLNSFTSQALNPNITAEYFDGQKDIWDSVKKSWSDTWHSSQSEKAFFIAILTTAFGYPTFVSRSSTSITGRSRYKERIESMSDNERADYEKKLENMNALRRWFEKHKLSLKAEWAEELRETQTLRQEAEVLAKNFNRTTDDEKMRILSEGVIRGTAIINEYGHMLENGDKKGALTAKEKEALNLVMTYAKLGRTDELISMAKNISQMTADEFKMLASKEYQSMSNEEIEEMLKKNTDGLLDTIQKYSDYTRDIYSLYGNAISESAMTQLVWTTFHLDSLKVRMEELITSVKDFLLNPETGIITVAQKSESMQERLADPELAALISRVQNMNATELMDLLSNDKADALVQDMYKLLITVDGYDVQYKKMLDNVTDLAMIMMERNDFVKNYARLDNMVALGFSEAYDIEILQQAADIETDMIFDKMVAEHPDGFKSASEMRKAVLEAYNQTYNINSYISRGRNATSLKEIMERIRYQFPLNSKMADGVEELIEAESEIGSIMSSVNNFDAEIQKSEEFAVVKSSLKNIYNISENSEDIVNWLVDAANNIQNSKTKEIIQKVLAKYSEFLSTKDALSKDTNSETAESKASEGKKLPAARRMIKKFKRQWYDIFHQKRSESKAAKRAEYEESAKQSAKQGEKDLADYFLRMEEAYDSNSFDILARYVFLAEQTALTSGAKMTEDQQAKLKDYKDYLGKNEYIIDDSVRSNTRYDKSNPYIKVMNESEDKSLPSYVSINKKVHSPIVRHYGAVVYGAVSDVVTGAKASRAEDSKREKAISEKAAAVREKQSNGMPLTNDDLFILEADRQIRAHNSASRQSDTLEDVSVDKTRQTAQEEQQEQEQEQETAETAETDEMNETNESDDVAQEENTENQEMTKSPEVIKAEQEQREKEIEKARQGMPDFSDANSVYEYLFNTLHSITDIDVFIDSLSKTDKISESDKKNLLKIADRLKYKITHNYSSSSGTYSLGAKDMFRSTNSRETLRDGDGMPGMTIHILGEDFADDRNGAIAKRYDFLKKHGVLDFIDSGKLAELRKSGTAVHYVRVEEQKGDIFLAVESENGTITDASGKKYQLIGVFTTDGTSKSKREYTNIAKSLSAQHERSSKTGKGTVTVLEGKTTTVNKVMKGRFATTSSNDMMSLSDKRRFPDGSYSLVSVDNGSISVLNGMNLTQNALSYLSMQIAEYGNSSDQNTAPLWMVAKGSDGLFYAIPVMSKTLGEIASNSKTARNIMAMITDLVSDKSSYSTKLSMAYSLAGLFGRNMTASALMRMAENGQSAKEIYNYLSSEVITCDLASDKSASLLSDMIDDGVLETCVMSSMQRGTTFSVDYSDETKVGEGKEEVTPATTGPKKTKNDSGTRKIVGDGKQSSVTGPRINNVKVTWMSHLNYLVAPSGNESGTNTVVFSVVSDNGDGTNSVAYYVVNCNALKGITLAQIKESLEKSGIFPSQAESAVLNEVNSWDNKLSSGNFYDWLIRVSNPSERAKMSHWKGYSTESYFYEENGVSYMYYDGYLYSSNTTLGAMDIATAMAKVEQKEQESKKEAAISDVEKTIEENRQQEYGGKKPTQTDEEFEQQDEANKDIQKQQTLPSYTRVVKDGRTYAVFKSEEKTQIVDITEIGDRELDADYMDSHTVDNVSLDENYGTVVNDTVTTPSESNNREERKQEIEKHKNGEHESVDDILKSDDTELDNGTDMAAQMDRAGENGEVFRFSDEQKKIIMDNLMLSESDFETSAAFLEAYDRFVAENESLGLKMSNEFSSFEDFLNELDEITSCGL